MVQLCARAVLVSSPARITTAPLGGDEGPPPRTALLPHIRTGGEVGLAAENAGGPAGAAGRGTAEESSNVSASQASPATVAAATAASTQPTGHLRNWRG